ncbi:MAG: hypothetical protein ACI84R_004260 [Candidatus Azotimanducaceae bacterium]|jgi:hypothetical protein
MGIHGWQWFLLGGMEILTPKIGTLTHTRPQRKTEYSLNYQIFEKWLLYLVVQFFRPRQPIQSQINAIDFIKK